MTPRRRMLDPTGPRARSVIESLVAHPQRAWWPETVASPWAAMELGSGPRAHEAGVGVVVPSVYRPGDGRGRA
jgi:hypothetical protein